jgi:3-oxoacyl-ACP reductase-like protein
MAKKTLKASYESHDIALGLERELLSYKKNADAIYYKIQAEEVSAVPSKPAAAESTTAQPAPAAAAPVAAPAPSQSVSIPDKVIAPVDVIAVLVAVALKKSSDEIAKDQTIKALCGGE